MYCSSRYGSILSLDTFGKRVSKDVLPAGEKDNRADEPPKEKDNKAAEPWELPSKCFCLGSLSQRLNV